MKTTLPSHSSKWFFLSIIIGLIIPLSSFSMSNTTKATINDPAKTETKLQYYTWYDGDQKRSVWVNPELLAEFSEPSQTTDQSSAASSSKKVNTTPAFVRILSIKSNTTVLKSTGKQRSPVFHNTAALLGAKKALPGNVIIQMKPSWTSQKIHSWFKQQNVIAIKPLTFAHNTFLIQSNAGLESLNLANRLYETGDVVLASPNWWQERVKR